MVSSFCSEKLSVSSILIQFHPFLSLFFCVLNFLFALVAAVSNALVIRALWKTSSIPGKKLLLSLAFSDLAVGLYAQPMYGTVTAVMLNVAVVKKYNFDFLCPTIITVTLFSAYFLAGASFFTIAAIALDRFLAVTLHLRYPSLVTERRVGVGLVFLWLTVGIATFAVISLPRHNNLVTVVFQSVGFAMITMAYLRIYKVVRHHQNRIYSQHQVQNDQAVKAARERKSALNAFYVYIISFACYVPSLFSSILLEVNGMEVSYVAAAYASIFLFFLNSSLNPIVYCWRYREIRNNVMSTAKKIFRIHDHALRPIAHNSPSKDASHRNPRTRTVFMRSFQTDQCSIAPASVNCSNLV